MPVRFCERSSADTGDPVHTQPSDWGGVPDSACNRSKRLITGAGICDDEKHRGGPVRLPLLEKRTQVLGLRLAGPRGRCNGHLERVVAVAEQDPLSFERHGRASWFGPGQTAPVVVLQEVLGILCWHPVLLISPAGYYRRAVSGGWHRRCARLIIPYQPGSRLWDITSATAEVRPEELLTSRPKTADCETVPGVACPSPFPVSESV